MMNDLEAFSESFIQTCGKGGIAKGTIKVKGGQKPGPGWLDCRIFQGIF
jgi:hypothetical protein